MKKYFKSIGVEITVFFLFFSIPMISFAEEKIVADDIFYVIHVEGDILHKESGEKLKTGDELKNENAVLFKTPDAWAVVISPQRGRLYLCPNPIKSDENSYGFTDFVKSCLLPSRKNVSTRLIPDREEIAFLISVLKGMKKSEAEIKTELLDFLIDVYYGESGEDQAKIVLEKEFQRK